MASKRARDGRHVLRQEATAQASHLFSHGERMRRFRGQIQLQPGRQVGDQILPLKSWRRSAGSEILQLPNQLP